MDDLVSANATENAQERYRILIIGGRKDIINKKTDAENQRINICVL